MRWGTLTHWLQQTRRIRRSVFQTHSGGNPTGDCLSPQWISRRSMTSGRQPIRHGPSATTSSRTECSAYLSARRGRSRAEATEDPASSAIRSESIEADPIEFEADPIEFARGSRRFRRPGPGALARLRGRVLGGRRWSGRSARAGLRSPPVTPHRRPRLHRSRSRRTPARLPGSQVRAP